MDNKFINWILSNTVSYYCSNNYIFDSSVGSIDENGFGCGFNSNDGFYSDCDGSGFGSSNEYCDYRGCGFGNCEGFGSGSGNING